jgi:hypothetical protein
MTPQERVTAYLHANKSRFEYSTLDLVVSDVKLSLFYGMSSLSDDEIRKVVVQWATVHAVGLLLRAPPTGGTPGTPAGSPANSESDLIAAVKKAVATIGAGVTIGKDNANINIGVTGPTANLKRNDKEVSVGISWGGTLNLEASSGPIHFSGSLSKDSWEMVVSFPQDTYIPDLSTLGKVFTEGESAFGRMAETARHVKNIEEIRNVGALVKPDLDKVQKAVEAAKGVAKAKGGVSFGFKVGSPDPMPGQQGIPPGVQGTIVFSYVF